MDREKPKFTVGYKRPPLHTRFKPGESGNPAGRPKKKTKTLAESIERELSAWITVNEGGRQRRITKLDAIAKQQINRAVKGDLKATVLVMRAVEPRRFEQMDNLSPVLQALRGIHAQHENGDRSGTRTAAGFDSSGDPENSHDCGAYDPD